MKSNIKFRVFLAAVSILFLVLLVDWLKNMRDSDTADIGREKSTEEVQVDPKTGTVDHSNADSQDRSPDTIVSSGPEYHDSIPELDMGDYVTMLFSQYEEQSHRIEELPNSSGPILLCFQIAREDIGSEVKKGAVLIQELPSGTETGYLMVRKEKIVDVNNLKSQARIRASVKTIATFSSKTINRNLEVEEVITEYTMGTDGIVDLDLVKLKTNDVAVVNKEFTIGVYKFPPEPVRLNEEFEITQNIPEDAPEAIKGKPIRLKGKLVKLVEFDDKKAVLVEAEEEGYHVTTVQSARIKRTFTSKVHVKARYYVDSETGQLLWAETVTEFIESDAPNAAGTVSTYREEIIPDR